MDNKEKETASPGVEPIVDLHLQATSRPLHRGATY